jgi:transcription elongation GreA/GreB family factor
MTKAALRDELLALLETALEAARAAHAAAIEGSTHPEAKAENEKDTRGLEQSYLARGVAQRVAELEAAVADVTRLELRTFTAASPVAMSALVTADEEGETHRFFLAPAGGGSTLAGGVQVLTTSSPLGRALLGKRVDDDVEVKLPGKTRILVVTALV